MRQFIGLIAAVSIGFAPSTMASGCFEAPPIADALAENSIAFVGEVIDTEIVDQYTAPFSSRLSVLKLIEAWKGEVAPYTVVVTASLGSAGGVQFQKGDLYLVVGGVSTDTRYRSLVGSDDVLVVHGCGPTRYIHSAADIPALRPKSVVPSSPHWVKLQ